MSFLNLYEYMHGEFQDVTRVPMAAAGVDPAWIIDPNGVKIAGHQIELWDAETGGAQLLEGVDYSLVFLDSGKTAAEGIDIWAGYQVINVAYQGIPLYITARIIGGYTKHNGGIVEEYELDGQHVTKWDTGRIEINSKGITTGSVVDLNLFGSTAGDMYNKEIVTYFAEQLVLVYSEQGVCDGKSVRIKTESNSKITLSTYNNTFSDTNYWWTVVGTWK